MGKNIHVTNHSQGGYQVKSSGSSKAYRRTETQRKAIEIGRELARISIANLSFMAEMENPSEELLWQ